MRKGYTLLECLIVMIVMVIILGLGGRIGNYIGQHDKVVDFINLVMSKVYRAQSLARRDKKITGIRIHCDESKRTLCIIQEVDPVSGGQWCSVGEKGSIPVPWRQDVWLRGSVCLYWIQWTTIYNTQDVSPGDVLELHNRFYTIKGFTWSQSPAIVNDITQYIPWVGLFLEPEPDKNIPPTCDFRVWKTPKILENEIDIPNDIVIEPRKIDILFKPNGEYKKVRLKINGQELEIN